MGLMILEVGNVSNSFCHGWTIRSTAVTVWKGVRWFMRAKPVYPERRITLWLKYTVFPNLCSIVFCQTRETMVTFATFLQYVCHCRLEREAVTWLIYLNSIAWLLGIVEYCSIEADQQ